MNVHLTLKSSNAKTGAIPVSTTERGSCPPSCPFNNDNGCYAGAGPLALHWRKVSAGIRGTDWAAFCDQIAGLPRGTFWRHNQAGDLPGKGEHIDGRALSMLVKANKGKRGFTYTHKTRYARDRAKTAKATASGFTINLSANNLAHADELAETGQPTVVVTEPAEKALKTPGGRTVVTCPATYRDTSCADCQMCQLPERGFIIGFPAHGTQKRKALEVCK